MKKINLILVFIFFLGFAAYPSCGIATSCGGGVIVSCAGNECCADQDGVTCDGQSHCCPQL